MTISNNLLHNPFDTPLGRTNSSYLHYQNGRLLDANTGAVPSENTRKMHDSLRQFIENSKFPCIGAKHAIRQNYYRFGAYRSLATEEAVAGLAYDLFYFARDQPSLHPLYTTYIASFCNPRKCSEKQFEDLLWKSLQMLHDKDSKYYDWDPEVSSDPANSQFSYSFSGRGYFVIGLHANSSQRARQFEWPTLVFNAHYQFEKLRETGRFEGMKREIRMRNQKLQGFDEAFLADFGEASEARQYSGRAVEADWKCPFQAKSIRPH